MKRLNMRTLWLLLLVSVLFSASAWGKTVTLSWDASPSDVAGYKIYYDTSSSSPLDGSGADEGGAPIDVGNVLTYTLHGLPDNSDHYFAVSAYDASGNESTYSNIVHSPVVTANNTPPVLATIGNKTVLEGATLSFTVSATDADGDSITYSVQGLPDGAGFNSSTGLFTWTPDLTQSNIYTVTFSASDGTDSDSESIQITVTNLVTNHPPTLESIGNKGVNEGETQYVPIVASDPDGDTLNYSFSGMPVGAVFDSQTKTFSWSTTYDQAGVYPITVTVSDGELTASQAFSITVSDVNRPPVLNPIGTKTVSENSLLSFTIAGSDPDNDALSYRAEDLPSGATFNPVTRAFNWTPDYGETSNTRVYPVTFIVDDGAAEDSEVVTINVTNVNRPPVLGTIGAQSLTEGDSYSLTIQATDPDNDPLTFSATNLPSGAVFVPEARALNWIPDNNQAGSYSVTFNVSDGTDSVSETVVLTVNNGNEAPVLDAIGSQTIAEGAPLEFVITASDPNGDNLTYSASSLPAGATFDAELQRFSWAPNYLQAGSFHITFSVTDGTYSDSEQVDVTVTNTNRPPIISGTASGSVMATTSYSFTPVASDPDDESLTFSISNKPSWATFNSESGKLSGVPGDGDIGSYPNIAISVSDGHETQALAPFSIDVVAYVYQDSDGDGVLDNLDAFPNDPNEWLDSDGDSIGNNSDPDDDNDGIADIRDGAPLDSSQAGWVITATASAGGYITPEGETSILYGGSQHYDLTPMAGYYVNDLLVDNVSVGLTDHYDFENIGNHHNITAVFAPIPAGLSCNPISTGLPGVERVDGGDDHFNLVEGKPTFELDYRFRVVLRASVSADQRAVFLILDDYKYPMHIDAGSLADGAEYVFTTRLGPAYSHQFYFTVEDQSGSPVGRYPENGTLAGPSVQLLNGKNVIGLAAKLNPYGLSAADICHPESLVYRWVPDAGSNGEFELVDAGVPISSSDGYVLKREGETALPDLTSYGQISDQTQEIQVKPGWNLISNPYAGNVSLKDVSVRHGDASSVSWLSAAANNLVVDGIYSYRGSDWGSGNEFSSAAGSTSATLIPWIGYWVYVNPTDDDVFLIIPKPLQ